MNMDMKGGRRKGPLNISEDDRRYLHRVGLALSRALHERGKSPEWLASRARIARSTMREILAGRSNPRLTTLRAIARAMEFQSCRELLLDLFC